MRKAAEHRAQGQRHAREPEEPGPVARRREDQRLLHVPLSSATRRRARSRRSWAHFKPASEAWARRIQSGQAMTQMINNIGRLDTQRALEAVRRLDRPHRRRRAAGRKPPRPQGVERNVVITLWDWADPKAYLHDEISTDRRNPTVNANGLIYGAPEESTDLFPVLDPVTPHGDPGEDAGARSEDAVVEARSAWRRRRTGATSRSGTARPACTTRCSTRRAGSGSPRAVRPPANPDFCKQGLGPSVGEAVPDRAVQPPSLDVRSEDRQVHADRHVLPDAPPGLRRGRQQHAVDQRAAAGRAASSAG